MPPTVEDKDRGEDTIVVKGENGSRTSSPDSLSPKIEPPTNPLAQINPQHLESPEAHEESPADGELPHTLPAGSSTRRPKANVTTMEDRLQQMPELRPLPWRPGVEEGADVETGGESRRKQIRFGCLLATRGQVQVPGCNSCQNGRGKFSLCVALDGYFKGACASCQLSGRPNRCSIKKEDDPVSSPAVGTPNGDSSFHHVQQATPSSDSRPSGPPRKRRRTSEVKRVNKAKNGSPKDIPQWHPQPAQLAQTPQPPQPPHPPQPPQPPQYQPIQWGQHSPQQAPQTQQASDVPQKTWATVNQPPPKPQVLSNGTNGNGHPSQEHYRPPTAMAWATVNQPQPQVQPLPHPQKFYPPQQAASSIPPPIQNGGDNHGSSLFTNAEQERRESTTGNEEGLRPLIDNLPKNKQRQVYGLISGLQGGIEHLHRELNLLKAALGIDDEN